MGAAAGDEEDEAALVFCRLGGGAVAALLVPVVCSLLSIDIFKGGLVVILDSGLIFLFFTANHFNSSVPGPVAINPRI